MSQDHVYDKSQSYKLNMIYVLVITGISGYSESSVNITTYWISM